MQVPRLLLFMAFVAILVASSTVQGLPLPQGKGLGKIASWFKDAKDTLINGGKSQEEEKVRKEMENLWIYEGQGQREEEENREKIKHLLSFREQPIETTSRQESMETLLANLRAQRDSRRKDLASSSYAPGSSVELPVLRPGEVGAGTSAYPTYIHQPAPQRKPDYDSDGINEVDD